MKYISTRGISKAVGFSQSALQGLSRDGGLLVPETHPDFSGRLKELSKLDYQSLALQLFIPFVGQDISEKDLKTLIDKSYSSFEHKDVTPLRKMGNNYLLELFHGPTLAFKDVALQFLGNLFELLLSQQNTELNILGATSGDTGSAAIYGVKGKKGLRIFMLHPSKKVSPIQERQMTTVLDENVFNIAFRGAFDDGQNIIKAIFNDLDFKDKYQLGAVNSINWIRVMAQIVYYFYAAFRFWDENPDEDLVFAVPTGNFGDIFAGYVAKKMGLPIKKLILATNENDILSRVLSTGEYRVGKVHQTVSPSMDIQVASNFERFLFDILDRDGDAVIKKMDLLKKEGGFSLSANDLEKMRVYFEPASVNTEKTLNTIKNHEQKGLILDPHSAVGVCAAEESAYNKVICLATAHPAKFPESVEKASGKKPEVPNQLQGILEKESRCVEVDAEVEKIKDIISKEVKV